MIPILYAAASITEGTVPTSYGIGALTDVIEAKCSEERNGKYELTFTYPFNGIHADQIQYGSFVKAKPNFTDDPQLFQVIKIGKTMNGQFTVYCQHVSYLLSGKVITTGTASSCIAACQLLTAQAGGFTIGTDKNVSADFEITEPSSVRSWFGGKKGSLLDVYGSAEWHYDNFTAMLKAHRGQDRNVQIRYGKNLTQLSQEINMENLCTGIVPFCIDNDGNKTVGTKVLTGLTLDFERDKAVDFSSDVDFDSATPLVTQLATLTSNYIANNNFTNVFNSITLDFVQLSNLQERVDLCDTVHIFFDALGITASLKCVACTWDVINERYTSCTFGDLRSSIADTIVTQEKKIDEKPSTSAMNQAIQYATDLISGNLGGYVILHDANGDGEPDELLILDAASGGDITAAVDVWRWNQAGLGHSGNGYSGPYDTVAITYDGKISASAVTTGVLNADLIKAGVISDVNGLSTIDMTSGQAKLYELIAKRNFSVIDENDLLKAYLSTLVNGTAGLFIRDVTGQSPRAILSNSSYDRGELDLYDENGVIRVTIYGDGGLVIRDANGNSVIDLDGTSGRVKAPKAIDKAFDGNISGVLTVVGSWARVRGDAAGLLIVGKVVSSGSRTSVVVPIEMLNTTPTRFYLSDESNYISFDCYTDGDDAVKIELMAKSSSGYIEKIYRMF